MISIDQTRTYWIALAGLIALMTVPRLLINYGMDGDSIRGMIAAQRLIETGSYIPSRLPGNPLFEYILALLSLFDGHFLTNAMILASFAAAICAFHRLSEGLEHEWLLVALFSLTPILLKNAVVTKDYIPGLAAILWSYLAATRGRYTWAYLLLGISTGLRLPNLLFVIPLTLFVGLKGEGFRKIALLVLLGLGSGLIWYTPVFLREGLNMFAMPPHSYHGLDYLLYTAYRFITVFGPIATVVIALLLVFNVRKMVEDSRRQIRGPDASFVLQVTTVLLFLLLFLRHSLQPEYLVPAIPFFYLLVWRWLGFKQLVLMAAAVIFFAFVTIEFKGGESGKRRFAFNPDWGIVVKDFLDRKELEALRRGMTRFHDSRRAVIVHGYGPMLGYDNPRLVKVGYRAISAALNPAGISDPDEINKLPDREIYLVSGLSKDNVELLQQEGYTLYCFSESAPSLALHGFGYDPFLAGMRRLDVSGKNAFYKLNAGGDRKSQAK